MNSLKSEDGSSVQNSEDEISRKEGSDKTRLVTGIGVNRVTIGDRKIKRNTQNLAKQSA
jgi:hypothetical protein